MQAASWPGVKRSLGQEMVSEATTAPTAVPMAITPTKAEALARGEEDDSGDEGAGFGGAGETIEKRHFAEEVAAFHEGND